MTHELSIPEVGGRFSAARLQRGLSQATVARRAGIAPSYLSRIENGKIQPTFRTAMKILQAMKADPEEVLGPRIRADRRKHGCPVTDQGRCLLDLIRHETDTRSKGRDESYSPRQVRLLRRTAALLRVATPARMRALEIVLDDLTECARREAGRRA